MRAIYSITQTATGAASVNPQSKIAPMAKAILYGPKFSTEITMAIPESLEVAKSCVQPSAACCLLPSAYCSPRPRVSGSAKASVAASKNASPLSQNAGPRPLRRATAPMAQGAAALSARPKL